ncbi:hypothetical protein SAMN05192558_101601 [Actinokineospora alba]|uniref:Uncharacterized protein n=1 Tax=Actinokineospora alba TaxID=504798 RepID=A0A1H0G0H8_9PSEU|nr:hypothetical protein [Actinokineospora alba]TDP69702.1 hypothetical protein C8E96_5296 [Actinokineospora alba]SDI10705.1 hypothetical protein SAMN05421871_103270 [Actinokineospora alba]SDO00249.1 hypothetical protein SAMN05192558_101601 [Actinokineospora alba]
MGRPRTRLTGALLCLLTLTACATTQPGEPTPARTTTQPTTTSAEPQTHGYQLPQGEQIVLHLGKTGTVKMKVGDTVVVQRTREVGQHPDTAVLTLAESREDGKLVFQATGTGKTSLYTEDPRPAAPCKSDPCPVGRPAPPRVTIEVA